MTKMILEGIVSKKYKFTTFNSNFYHEKVSEDIPFVFFPGKLGAGKKKYRYLHSLTRCTNMQISGNKGSGSLTISGSFDIFSGIFKEIFLGV